MLPTHIINSIQCYIRRYADICTRGINAAGRSEGCTKRRGLFKAVRLNYQV